MRWTTTVGVTDAVPVDVKVTMDRGFIGPRRAFIPKHTVTSQGRRLIFDPIETTFQTFGRWPLEVLYSADTWLLMMQTLEDHVRRSVELDAEFVLVGAIPNRPDVTLRAVRDGPASPLAVMDVIDFREVRR